VNYEDGMDALAERYIETVGVDAASIAAALLSSGGEIAKGFAQTSAEKAAGEAEWARMKRAADAAKWPVDISAQVVLADKNWQAVKNTGNVDSIRAAIGQMQMLANQIEMRLGIPSPMGTGLPMMPVYPPPPQPWPLWAKLLAGVGAAVGGVLAYKAIKK